MHRDRCKLCRKPAELSYEVQRDRPIPLCGACMGAHCPCQLNRALGVTPDDGIEACQHKEESHAEPGAP